MGTVQGTGEGQEAGQREAANGKGKIRTTHIHAQAVAMLYGKEAGQQGAEGNGTRNGK